MHALSNFLFLPQIALLGWDLELALFHMRLF